MRGAPDVVIQKRSRGKSDREVTEVCSQESYVKEIMEARMQEGKEAPTDSLSREHKRIEMLRQERRNPHKNFPNHDISILEISRSAEQRNKRMNT